jgi:hypothetical protein
MRGPLREIASANAAEPLQRGWGSVFPRQLWDRRRRAPLRRKLPLREAHQIVTAGSAGG